MDAATVCTAVDAQHASTPDVMRWVEARFGPAVTTRSWASVHRILNAVG
jgi:hypothetical protein